MIVIELRAGQAIAFGDIAHVRVAKLGPADVKLAIKAGRWVRISRPDAKKQGPTKARGNPKEFHQR